MGWKGTIRTVQAGIRAVEREAKKKQRVLDRQQREYNKMVELEQAAYEVEEYDNYIARLISIHTEGSHPINWGEIAAASEPTKPIKNQEREIQAQANLKNYQPTMWDKLFRRIDKMKTMLQSAIEGAKEEDEAEYKEALQEYETNYKDWKDSRNFAERILSGDTEAYLEVIDEMDPFSEIQELGSSVKFISYSPVLFEGELHVHSDDVIPKESKGLLKSGKLTVKSLPKGQFNELYQDYVCSGVLRVARELFALLPLKSVIVTATDNMLNSQTGHLEDQPILSVAIPLETFNTLNLDAIDPSDSMGNFIHNMNFKKTAGFSSVDKVEPSAIRADS